MALDLSILYRGELSGCNYACGYCPFAKRVDSAEQLQTDRGQVERFVKWVKSRRQDRLGIFFTPWGEALIRRWYQQALVRLSQLPQVGRVAIQTNLSAPLDWVHYADRKALGLWCTYHPGEVERDRFVAKCRQLDAAGVRYSVGIVGLREHFGEIEAVRRLIPPHVYVWINAYKRQPNYYTEVDVDRLAAIDPLFEINNWRHPSHRKPCGAGETAISVDGEGTIRRCHFIPDVLGNLYEPGWESALQPRACSNETCGCHIGYVHLKELRLAELFGDGLLDRSLHQRPNRREALQRVTCSALRAQSVSSSVSNASRFPSSLRIMSS